MTCGRCVVFVILALLTASRASGQVVVESIVTPSASSAAGVHVGDRLLSWARSDRTGVALKRGRFRSPFDVRSFEIEQLPLGRARLTIERKEQRLVLALGLGPLGLDAGLALAGQMGRKYGEGLTKARAKDIDGAERAWHSLSKDLVASNRSADAAWLLTRIGSLLIGPVATGFYGDTDVQGRHIDLADLAYADAIALARQLGDTGLEAFVQESAGASWSLDGLDPWRASLGRVRKNFGEALRLRTIVAPDSLGVAAAAHSLAAVWAWYDDPKEPPDPKRAVTLYEQAVVIRHRLAPGSYEEALSRLKLTLLLYELGEQRRAYAEARQAAAILQRTAPGARAMELCGFIGALLAGDAGEYAEAARLYRVALPIAMRRPDFQRATVMDDESLVLLASGRFAAAGAAFRRYLVMSGAPPVFSRRAELADSSHDLDMYVMLDFGRYADELGNRRSAAVFLRLALHAVESAGVPSGGDRDALRDTSCAAGARLIAIDEATPAETRRFDNECSEWMRTARTQDPYGESLLLLSRAELARGRPDRARLLATEAVQLRSRGGPRHWLAAALVSKGEALCASGQLASGILALQHADRLYENTAARERGHVAALSILGTCQSKSGQLSAASESLRSAVTLAEALGLDKPSDRSRAFETAELSSAYAELTGVLIDLHRPIDAFEATERGRARAFRKMIAERNLTPDGPKWLFDLEDNSRRKRQRLFNAYDAAQKELEDTPLAAVAQRERRTTRLHAIALQLDAWESQLHNVTPLRMQARAREAGATPATIAEIGTALADGTALIEYSVGRTLTRVFVLESSSGGPRLTARTLPVGDMQLADAVERFRDAVQAPGAGEPAEVQALGAKLYSQLVLPVEDLIASAPRLLVVPDGPLHALPFGALKRLVSRDDGHYLVEWKPIHVAPSASGYVLLRQMPRPDDHGDIVAVGDPASATAQQPADATRGDGGGDEAAETDPGHDEDARGGVSRALPGSRREVLSIARILGPGVITLIGADASETRIKDISPTTRILHFATHATVNGAITTNSGLTLAKAEAGAPNNGYLQAWEIADQLRFRGDLVTLSACDSAGGRTLEGEGVMSLARAFHYAGARSVVSTLWSIDDRATADLMSTFYTNLKAGVPKDEALRRAQLAFINAPPSRAGRRSPAYWAAFQLSGDWQ